MVLLIECDLLLSSGQSWREFKAILMLLTLLDLIRQSAESTDEKLFNLRYC